MENKYEEVVKLAFKPIKTKESSRLSTETFYGINRTNIRRKDDFSQTLNLSSREFPKLTCKNEDKEININGINPTICLPFFHNGENEGFYGIGLPSNGEQIYLNNAINNTAYAYKDIEPTNLSFCKYRNCITSFPNAVTAEFNATDMYQPVRVRKGSGHCVRSTSGVLRYFFISEPHASTIEMVTTDGKLGDFDAGDKVVVCQTNKNTGVKSTIYGYGNVGRCEYCVVTSKTNSASITVYLYDKNGNKVTPPTTHYTDSNMEYSVENYTLKMSGCKNISDNRLCGIMNDKIFISEKNGHVNFEKQRFDADGKLTPESSWSAQFISASGAFTAVGQMSKNTIVAFKKNEMYLIEGRGADEYNMYLYAYLGCTNFNANTVISGKLYFINEDGMYCFDGDKYPEQIISFKDDGKVTGVLLYTKDNKYIGFFVTINGIQRRYLYDTQNKILHEISNTNKFVQLVNYGADNYGLTDTKKYIKLDDGERSGVLWECVFNSYIDEMYKRKHLIRLLVNATIVSDYIDVYISYDDKNSFSFLKRLLPSPISNYIVPVSGNGYEKFSIKLVGKGEFVLNGIERIYDKGVFNLGYK